MALIIEFRKDLNGKVSKSTDTICEYKSGIVNNEKIVAFSTDGSANREKPGKSSQILHFNKDSAVEFIKILKEEFKL